MTVQELHDDKVRHVAEQYRQRGYEIVAEPDPAMIPGFDDSLRPDLLAKKERDQIVIEVKSRRALRDSDTVRRMADALARKADWRFELVLLEDSDAQTSATATAEAIRSQLTSAKLLLEHGQPSSAFVLIWIAIEAALRKLALAHLLQISDASPLRLIRELTFNGLLSREDYDLLNRQFQVRNQIVHGFDAPVVTVTDIEMLRDLATRLIDEGEKQSAAA